MKSKRLTFWSEVQCDRIDWTASTHPARQVEAGVAGVKVGEDGLIFVELGFWKNNNYNTSVHKWSDFQIITFIVTLTVKLFKIWSTGNMPVVKEAFLSTYVKKILNEKL